MYLVIFFFALLVHSESLLLSLNVSTSHHLEEILCCNDEIFNNNDVRLFLYTNVTHLVTSGAFCAVNISHHSLTITSYPTDNNFALIKCISNDTYWTRGFAFHGTNGSSVTMNRLNFTNCGTNLSTLDDSIINFSNSPIRFTQYHGAALVFTNISSLTIANVAILKYKGFAVVAVNLPHALFQYLIVSDSQDTKIGTGKGLLILLCNCLTTATANEYQINITDSTFHKNNKLINNYNQRVKYPCASTRYRKVSPMPVVNAAGVTILQADTIPAVIRIQGSSFTFCNEQFSGAMLILNSNISINSQTIIDSCYFQHNSIQQACNGAAIDGSFFFDKSELNKIHKPLSVTNTNFTNNGFNLKSRWTSGAIQISTYKDNDNSHGKVILLFRNLYFEQNTAPEFGSCLSVVIRSSPNDKMDNWTNFIFESIVAHSNPNLTVQSMKKDFNTASLFHFENIKNLTINGTSMKPGNFSYNYGSIFEILQSDIVLKGYLIFHGNIGNHGAAFNLHKNSAIFLTKGLIAKFTNNTVQTVGGAIYSRNEDSKQTLCTFQLFSSKDYTNISLTFINNTAGLAGNSIYSTNLYNCNMKYFDLRGKMSKVYTTMFKNISSTDVSSLAKCIQFCNEKMPGKYEIYPGGSVHIPVTVRDQNQSLTYDILTIIPVAKGNFLKKLNWWFSNYQGSFVIKGKENCTTINLTIHTTDVTTLNYWSMLLLSISRQNTIIKVDIKINSCPLGFKLSTTGSCVCSDLLNSVAKGNIMCNIENNTFTKPSELNIWLGNSSTGNKFTIANCNPSYCNIGSQLNLLHFNSTGSYLSSTNDSSVTLPLCHGYRTGDACGECISNYSVVFGSSDCKDCSSHWWLLTSIFYILAGPLLVLIMYTLKLTLTTGTLNSVIFYAQITNVGIIRYLNIPCRECASDIYFVRLPSILISWLNLNLGFSLCFYDGMTEIWKAGLSLLFPIYLLLIVGLLIILSRYSVRVSNRLSRSSVQVLVTIVHLSFTKLLQSVLDVYSSSHIFIEGQYDMHTPKTVWYNSAAIEYNSTSHIRLMIITSVIAGFILVPYATVLLFGNFMLKFDTIREYIRPFYEAIHAPYRLSKWYWFALHQIFVLFVYVSETFITGRTVLFLALILVYHILFYLQTRSVPFKHRTLNWLNFFLLFILNVVFLVSQFIYLTGMSSKHLVMFFAIANYPVIVIFMLIIVYHILLVKNKVNQVVLLYEKLRQLKEVISNRFRHKRQYSNLQQRRRYQNYYGCSDSGDYTQPREPLLDQTLID